MDNLEKAKEDDSVPQEEINRISIELQSAYKDEEDFWKQKSRTLWHQNGDHYINYFFAVTKQRRVRNRITGLENEEGAWVKEEKELIGVITGYFDTLFATSNPEDLNLALKAVQPLVTEDMNRILMEHITEEEVKAALFLIHPEKALRPDRMTALFYQESWNIIKHDLANMVKEFFRGWCFDDRMNQTNICLIPKNGKPRTMSEFRPISLCNMVYKIISKILCQRLKRVLPNLISETQ